VSRVTYDTMDDDDRQIGVGLGCNGVIEVLFVPIDPHAPDNSIEQLRSILETRSPVIHMQIIEVSGDQALLGQNKIFVDNGDNSFMELPAPEVDEMTSYAIENRKNKIYKDVRIGESNCKMLCEFIRPEYQLVIVGDNYDVNSMIAIADLLGWKVNIAGRKKKMSKRMYALAHAIYEYEEIAKIEIDRYSAVLLMSHDYNWDLNILKQILDKDAAYIGILGPKKRTAKMQNDLSNIDLDNYDNLHSPTGLDIGAESPEEIAISIVAEIIAHVRNRDGGYLKNRKGTIHVRD